MLNYFSEIPIDEGLRQHLFRVYSTLAATLVASAVGCVAHLRYNVGGLLTSLISLAIMAYLGTDADKRNTGKRVTLLGGFGFFQGCSIGPLIQMALYIDPSIIGTAFLGTACVFICFSLSALLAARQSYLALGGLLSTGLSFLLLTSLIGLFFPSALLYKFHLYAGLLIFCGYVLYDTQLIMERYRAGDDNFIWHGLELFVDFIAIFVRLIIILMNNSDKNQRKKDRR